VTKVFCGITNKREATDYRMIQVKYYAFSPAEIDVFINFYPTLQLGLQFRMDEPQILEALSSKTVYELNTDEKLKIMHCLMLQVN
jgi:hypothetical protein